MLSGSGILRLRGSLVLVPSLILKKMRGSGSRGRTWGYAAADADAGDDAGDAAGDDDDEDDEDDDCEDEGGDDDSDGDGDGSGCGGGDDGDDGDGDGGGEEEQQQPPQATRGNSHKSQPRPSELNFRSPKSQAPVVKLGPIGQARRVLPGDVSATALAWAEFFKISLLSNPGPQHGLGRLK